MLSTAYRADSRYSSSRPFTARSDPWRPLIDEDGIEVCLCHGKYGCHLPRSYFYNSASTVHDLMPCCAGCWAKGYGDRKAELQVAWQQRVDTGVVFADGSNNQSYKNADLGNLRIRQGVVWYRTRAKYEAALKN
jgi:hypothetical protein